MEKLQKIFSYGFSLINPKKWYLWIAINLIFRFALAYFYPWFDYLHILRHPDEYSAFFEYCFLKQCCSCNICDYLCPAENLVTWGCFGPHTTRLPGYAIIYLPFRLFLPTFYAMISMAILHILIGAIASYLLAKAVYMVSNSKTLFLFTFIMYGLNPYVTRLDITPYADALSTYFVSISIYLITEYMIKQNRSLLIYSGLLLGWSAFMRPANIVLFIPSSIALLLLIKESNVIKKIKTALLFLYPVTIIMTSFYLYYYIETGELFRIKYHQPYDHPYARKMQLVHGLLCYPNTDFSLKYPPDCDFGSLTMGFIDTIIARRGVAYPATAYIPNLCFYTDAKDPFRAYFSKCPQTTKFNTDSLMVIRDLVHLAVKVNDEKFYEIIKLIDQKLGEYIESVKKEKYIDYYLTLPIKAYIHLITDSMKYQHKLTYSGFGYIIRVLLIILFHSAPQIIALILLIPSIIISIMSRNKLLLASALLTTSSIALAFAYISVGLSNQPRYLLSGLPYICWGIGVMTYFLYTYIKKKSKL
jgi:hypothetical protein